MAIPLVLAPLKVNRETRPPFYNEETAEFVTGGRGDRMVIGIERSRSIRDLARLLATAG